MEEKGLMGGDGDQAAAAQPSTLRLRYVVQACARCLLRLCGGVARADLAPAPAKADRTAADGGVKTTEDLQLSRVLLLSSRRNANPNSPGNPTEGGGGDGGSHN
ncbi:unnamed protein product [Alopecurus aequalis]